jgi:hypothetical protein
LVQVHVPELKIDCQLLLVHRRQGTLSHAAQAFLKVIRTMAHDRGAPFCYRPVAS